MFERFGASVTSVKYLDMLHIFEPLEVLFDLEYSGLIKRKLAYERPIMEQTEAVKDSQKKYQDKNEELQEYMKLLNATQEFLKALDEADIYDENGNIDPEKIKKVYGKMGEWECRFAKNVKWK
eukprot:UN24442